MASYSGNSQTHVLPCRTTLSVCVHGAVWLLLLLHVHTSVSDKLFVQGPGMGSWYTGFLECFKKNMTMPGVDFITRKNMADIQELLPLWLYAFQLNETRGSKSDYYAISSYERDQAAFVYCLYENGTFVTMPAAETYDRTIRQCGGRSNIVSYEKRFHLKGPLRNSDFWVKEFDNVAVGNVLNHHEINYTVRCLVLDEDYEVKVDSCQANHNSICVNATVETTVRFLGNAPSEAIPHYRQEWLTSASSSSDTKTTRGRPLWTVQRRPSTRKIIPTDKTTVLDKVKSKRRGLLMDQDLLIALIAVGVSVAVAVCAAIYCCYCRKRGCARNKDLHLAEAYSETADSINDRKLTDNKDGVSEYATPDDAMGVKYARPRNSIIEGEYDTLHQNNTKRNQKRKVAIVNAYSHVAIVQPNPRRASSSQDDSHYDVTTYTKHPTASITPDEPNGKIYGRLDSIQT